MEINKEILDKAEEVAKLACSKFVDMDLAKDSVLKYVELFNPQMVLSLIERIRELEEIEWKYKDLCK